MTGFLEWESAGTDEPGDQNASTRALPHGYWSLGPTNDGEWGVELIELDDQLQEVQSGGVHLGHFDSEAEAKAAAEEYEMVRIPHCVWVFETSETDGGYIPSIVYGGVSGHYPLSGRGEHASPWVWGPTIQQARLTANEYNERLGISPEQAVAILMSTFDAHFAREESWRP